jgi:hypothetical protein
MTERRTIRVTVGPQDADIIGSDHRALQAAVDYVANLGGGRVDIGPGRYDMRDSLHLRSAVSIWGAGADTVLVKSPAAQSSLLLDGDFGEEQVTLETPERFAVGDGITMTDDRTGGFHVVVATILWREGDTFGVSKPMNNDYMVDENARAATSFPVVSGYYVDDVSIDGITIEGNKEENPRLSGCRGGGIFLYRSHGTAIRNCRVYNFAGDGISFQQSDNVSVEACHCRGNENLGLHPGSGSGSPTIRHCLSEENGQIGLFLCWRVVNGIFEHNRLLNNGSTGISIGHKDTDNLFRANEARGNRVEGVLFRDESEAMAGHRNRFEENLIIDNGNDDEGYGVRIRGETGGLQFVRNRIGNRDSQNQRIGIQVGEKAAAVELVDNDMDGNTETAVMDLRV